MVSTPTEDVLHCVFRRCQRSVVRTMKSIRRACITDLPSDENRTVGEMKISRSINREFHARSAMYLYYVRPPTRDARFRPPCPRRIHGFIYTLISIDRGIRARLNYQTKSPMHVLHDENRGRSSIKACVVPIYVTCDLVACWLRSCETE